MDKKFRAIIAKEFRDCVLNTIKRLDNAETNRPFHAALLSDEALFWSRFERSFSTSFGQRVIEEISKVVALAGGATQASRQKVTRVQLDIAVDAAINGHMTSLRTGRSSYNNWEALVAMLLNTPHEGKTVEYTVTSDLWWLKDGANNYMSIKTVKPNIDQTAVAKTDLLRLVSSDPKCEVYLGLYYNPYGEERTSYAHNPPMGIFNFHKDGAVLIGRDYWDTLGGDGCYDIVLEIAREVGAETRETLSKLR
jgi:hypothetical protein